MVYLLLVPCHTIIGRIVIWGRAAFKSGGFSLTYGFLRRLRRVLLTI